MEPTMFVKWKTNEVTLVDKTEESNIVIAGCVPVIAWFHVSKTFMVHVQRHVLVLQMLSTDGNLNVCKTGRIRVLNDFVADSLKLPIK